MLNQLFCFVVVLGIIVSAQSFGVPSNSGVAVRTNANSLTMKIFDWKARDAFLNYEIPDGT